MKNIKREKRIRRHKKIRSRLAGTAERPRLTVFKSNRYLYASLVDDDSGKTIASASSQDFKKTVKDAGTEVGSIIAKLATDKGVKKVVFDRSGYVYRGKIKAIADGARKAGLVF